MTAGTTRCALIAAVLVAAAAPARAGAPPKPPQSLFRQVIPAPTGKNGYEELVLAADSLKRSRLFQQARDGEPTLAEKRRVLADPPVQRALTLLRQGLSKPVFSPRESLSLDTLLPELSEFRNLARLLKMRQYVLLADGRTAEAVAEARLCLRLGQAVQTDTLVGGLVGVAIGAIGVRSLGEHLDQLSARDCERLFQVCLEWLRQPDPQPRLLEIERRVMTGVIADTAARLRAGDASALAQLGLEGESLQQAQAFVGALPPGALDALERQTNAYLETLFVEVMTELKKPAWQRDFARLEPEQDGTPIPQIAGLLLPAYGQVDRAFAREQAHVRLLAAHCAIRRYRWEHDRLPENLEVLNLGELALDPFTGETLQYEPRGRTYRLTSAGPPAPADDPKAVGGRLPVSIVPE
jgi:hypothetical protein